MSWQVEMVEMLRIMINDFESPVKFSDTTLEKVIVTSAQYVITDVTFDFNQVYVPDIVTISITPDPTDRVAGTRDDDFINLTLLKAACFIDNCSAREAARKSGITIKEWATTIDTKGVFAAAAAILEKGWCKNYDEALYATAVGNSLLVGTGILGPFRQIYNAYSAAPGFSYSNSELFNPDSRR